MKSITRLTISLTAAFALVPLTGCFKDESAVGATERMVQAAENSKSALESQGVKMSQKSYPEMPNQKAWAIDLTGQKLNQATFSQLTTLGYISELNLSKTNLTDGEMKTVNGLTQYCLNLDLSNTDITDTGLAELKNQFVLRQLNLAGTKCTPEGVEALKKRISANPNARLKNPSVKLK